MNGFARLALILMSLPGTVLPAAGETVEGRVTDAVSGLGVANVTVLFVRDGAMGEPYRTTTDREGRFRIEGIAAGIYKPLYTARGYRPVTPDSGVDDPSITVGGSSATRLEVRLQPNAKVSGRVLDGAGKPVPNAAVWALRNNLDCEQPHCLQVFGRTLTDAKGAYIVNGLQAGSNLILVATPPAKFPPPDSPDGRPMGWAQTFYPNVTDPHIAAHIPTEAGNDRADLDIKLAAVPVYHVRGRVLDPEGNAAPGVEVSIGNGFGPGSARATDKEGTFDFPTVPVGDYRVMAMTDKSVIWWGAADIYAGRGDMDRLDLHLAAPFPLHAKLVWKDLQPGAQAPDPPDILLAPGGGIHLEGEPREPIGRPGATGAMIFDGVYPAAYHPMLLSSVPAPFYLDSIELGGRDDLTAELPIPSDAQPLTFAFRADGGTVHGTVESCGGARVMLVPQDRALVRAEFVHAASCQSGGQFTMGAVRPGEYYAYALRGDSQSRPAAIYIGDVRQQAARVTVRANETSNVDLRVIDYK